MIVFSCRQCATRFKVPDDLAGKHARCKKCGQSLKVPHAPAAVASAAATGLFRMGAVQVDPTAPRPPSQVDGKSHARSAVAESLRLAPIPSLDDLQPVKQKRERLWEDDDGVDYELEKPIEKPAAKPALQLPKQRTRLFWGRGGIAESLLVLLRKLSDYAYLVSVLFILLLLLAIVLKQRELAVIAAVIVILLNVVRLGIDGFVLVTLAFKNGPVEGVLFFLPPFTFYYLNKRGRVMKEAARRFLGPAVPIAGVLLLFIFVPWLRGGETTQDATIRGRIRSDLRTVKENVENKVLPSQDSKN